MKHAMTKPTGRKPMRVGAVLLKEVPYQNEWRIQATWRDPDRKKKWFNNWRHAEEFAAKENKRLELLKEKGAGRYTFNDAAGSYLEWSERRSKAKDNTGISLDTLKNRHGAMTHLRPKFGPMRLAEITTRLVSDWIIEQQVTAEGNTVRSRYAELNRVLEHAVDRDMLLVNPLKVKKISRKLLGEVDKRADIPARSDLETLREYINGPRPINHGTLTWSCRRVVVVLAVSCGLRAGEASALEWDDIDPDNGEIAVNKSRSHLQGLKAPKTKASRRKIPTSAAVREIINQHAEIYKELYGKCVGPVLRSHSRNYLSAVQVSTLFKNTMRDCGLVKPGTNEIKFTHHAGRHWAASHWMKSTADVHQTSKWIGHKNASMTLDVYGHCLDDPEARAKFERMPDWLIAPVQIDSPSATQPIVMESSRALPMPAPEDPFELDPKANGAVEPDCPIHVPNIAEPWVKPFLRLLQEGMPVLEAYHEIMPTIAVRNAQKAVIKEFKRLKMPPPQTVLSRLRAERILKLHAQKYQQSDIARLVGLERSHVSRVLRSRHKPNANNPLNRKRKPPGRKVLKTQPEHKIQLKLL